VDYSLHRLYHYTRTDPEHFQNFVIFTNYQFYVDMFARLSRERMVSGHADSDAFVEPGNVITRNARLGGGTAGVALGRMPQMPALHLVERDSAELNRNWTRPKAAIARLAMSSTSVRSSTLIASALLPFLLSSAAVSPAPFSLISAQTTAAPSRAKISALARPMPLGAPVIMMVFP
jgi:hypothetical protein